MVAFPDFWPHSDCPLEHLSSKSSTSAVEALASPNEAHIRSVPQQHVLCSDVQAGFETSQLETPPMLGGNASAARCSGKREEKAIAAGSSGICLVTCGLLRSYGSSTLSGTKLDKKKGRSLQPTAVARGECHPCCRHPS